MKGAQRNFRVQPMVAARVDAAEHATQGLATAHSTHYDRPKTSRPTARIGKRSSCPPSQPLKDRASIPYMAMPSHRARRSAAQAARRGDEPCDVPHCNNTCKRALPDCQHVVCTHCVFNMLGVRPGDGGPVFAFKCPICRRGYDTESGSMKHQMATFATGHVKEMPCCCGADCGKVYAVKHSKCSKGCYDCEESLLDLGLEPVRPLGRARHGVRRRSTTRARRCQPGLCARSAVDALRP